MKIRRLTLAIIFFLLPILMRGVWYYHGFYFPNYDIQSPDFGEFSVIQPPLSTIPPIPLRISGSGIKVLFDQAHNNKYTSAEIESLRNLLLQQGAEILELEIKSDLPDLLNKVDAFVIITPTDFYSTGDIESIENFVQRRGRLLVIADPTRSYSEYDIEREKSVILANEILEPFKISFRNDYIYNLVDNEGNYRNIFVIPETLTPLTRDISQLVFYAAHSINSGPKMLFSGSENTLSSLDDRADTVPVAAVDSSGNVLVFGDMTFLTTPYNQVADNYQLVVNISNFLLSDIRQRTLVDFPNLFSRSVNIRITDGISLDEDLLEVISDLKRKLESEDIQVVLLENEQEGYDQIFLGVYPPNEEVQKYTSSYGIDFGNDTLERTPTLKPTDETTTENQAENGTKVDKEFFFVPNFGKIPSKGFGFLLLNHEENRTNFVLLADSQENVTKLLNLLVKESLEICLSSDFVAVCQQDAIHESISVENETLSTPEESAAEENLIEGPDLTSTPDAPIATPTPEETPAPG